MEIGEFESEGDVKFLGEIRGCQLISTKNETLSDIMAKTRFYSVNYFHEEESMKKSIVLFVVSFVALFSSAVYAGGAFKAGPDFGGEIKAEIPYLSTAAATEDVDNAASLAIEVDTAINKNFDLGGGIEIQAPREMTRFKPGEFNFIPIYALMRLHPKLSDITPYLTLQLGFAIFNADNNFKGNGVPSPGGHVGIGCGVIMDKNFLFEILVTVDTGSIEWPGNIKGDVEYSKGTLSVGFYF